MKGTGRFMLHQLMLGLCGCCMQTVPATTPSSAETTTTLPACAGCSPDTPFLTPGNAADLTSTPTSDGITFDANGCANQVITCDVVVATNSAFLQFNDLIGGPCQPNSGLSTCMATLVCNSQMQWTFTSAGVTTVVTSAQCLDT